MPKTEAYNWITENSYTKPEKVDHIQQALLERWPSLHIEECDDQIDRATLENIHTSEYLNYLMSRETVLQEGEDSILNDVPYIALDKEPIAEQAKRWYYCSDTYTSFTKYIRKVACSSYNAVHTAGKYVLRNWWAWYALTRPPGHHAMPGKASGYCYLANASIFTEYAVEQWKRPVILDIDFHHGNGAQTIFYDRSDVLTCSIHADPARKFPYFTWFEDEIGVWDGIGYNMNICLEAWADEQIYLHSLDILLERVQAYEADILIVCLWFDTYQWDPICDFDLSIGSYSKIAKKIKEIGLPTLYVQEGGYDMEDIWNCAVSFFEEILD